MRNGIFISYRRSDTEGEASRLAEDLRERLDNVQIFRDVETIAPGEDFAEALERALGDCEVLLALIGPTWLEARNDAGKRRLDDETDWVRQEVSRALARKVRVIPVTCRNATPPKESELPADIALLSKRQAIEIDNNRWRYDVDQLIDRLVQSQGFRRRGGQKPTPTPAPLPPPVSVKSGARKGILIGVGATLGILAVIIWAIGAALEEATPDIVAGMKMASEMASAAKDQRGSGSLPSNPPPVAPVATSEPAPRPRPTTVPAPAPSPAPAAPSRPDLSGLWRSNDGDVYSFQQQGSEVLATVQVRGVVLGAGRGVLNGQILQLALVLTSNAQVQVNCSMQADPNFQSFTGVCSGPGGQYPAHIYR